MIDKEKNIIVTGIPRSGTTLLTSLIESSPDAVGLHEPGWQVAWATQHAASSAADFAKWLPSNFQSVRQELLAGTPINDRRNADGSSPTNYYQYDEQQQKMQEIFQIQPITKVGLSPHFTLAIKHNGLFIGALPEIIRTQRFTIIAIVRRKEEVLASWRRLQLPVSRGRLPAAERYWPKMRAITHTDAGIYEKQELIYDLCMKRLSNWASDITLIEYELLVNQPDRVMSQVGVHEYDKTLIKTL